MAGPKQTSRVEVVSPTGERGTVAPEDVASLPDGARVLTAQELAQERIEKQYANRSLAEKAIAFGITGDITPEMGAYREAAQGAASAGVIPAATRVALDTAGPAGAGSKYTQRTDDLATAYPGSSAAGSVAGFLGGTAATMATGGATGVAGAIGKATPMGALSAAGAPVEHAVSRALGGLATRGALGRAAQRGASMAVRGAVEGAAYAGIEQAASDVLHDEHTTGSKLYSAAQHGGLMGFGIGGALGVTGSLLGSGMQRLRAGRPAMSLTEGTVPPPPSPRVEVPFVDPEAGLKAGAERVERPFSIGSERRPVQLRPGGRPRVGPTESPISITRRMSIDPDAGLFAPEGRVTELLYPGQSEQLRFAKHPNAKSYETTVSVDAAELDRAWSADKDFYIGAGEEGIAGRREGFQTFRRKNPDAPIQASRVSVGDDGRVSFTDGRHRFAELRDGGARRVAITIPKEDLAKLPESFRVERLGRSGLVDQVANLNLASGSSAVNAFRPELPRIPTEPAPEHIRVYHSGPEKVSVFRPDTSFATSPSESIPYLGGRRGWITYADLPEASVASEGALREASESLGKQYDYAFEMADDPAIQKALVERGYKAVRYRDMGPENAYEHATVRVLTGDAKAVGHARVSPSGRQTARAGTGPRALSMIDDGGLAPLRLDSSPVRQRFDIGLDPDAGISARDGTGRFQGKAPATEDAFRLSSAKRVPRNVDVNVNESLDPLATTSPIQIPELPASPTSALAKEAKTFLGGMTDAGEQAWRAVGGGFGLQSTRYAKEAAKHFGSTAEVGRIALKHGLIDMGAEGKSPLAAAYQAAKSGTAGDILPRAQLATETVGKKLGELTEASGARVSVDDVARAAVDVADSYAKQAGRSGLRSAALQYGEELRAVLRPGADGKVSVQDLLEQRKFLDDIVYEESKTLDPKGRVKALREVRAKLESTIASALDDASGRMPGELRAEYNALKRDYHGLRILSEVAEDSATRAAKGATFGLGEKFAIASSVASGHLTAAPVLAVGGKMLRERGNAAAAAYLSRASTQGSFDSVVRAFDRRLEHAARGVLASGDRTMPSAASRAREPARALPSAGATVAIAAVKASREHDRQTQLQAEQIMTWVGDMIANPERVTRQVEEVAAEIAQAIGPKAAEGYSASTMRAISFIAGYIPIKERRDPLDPRSVPPLMRDEAIRLVRATKYALRPETIYEDFGRGVITPEGLRAAKFIDPDSFTEFQLKLQEHVDNHMLRNRQLTQSQRLRIDKLLGYPAGADLRPKSIARRQANYDVAMNGPSGSPPAPTGNGPVNMNTQQSGFDAVESRMAG